MRAVVALSVLSLGVGVVPLGAQAVVGTVIESGSRRPAVGAMVRLTNEAGPVGPHYLTAEDGRYRIFAPSPGTYGLLVERIGLAQARLGPVELVADSTLAFDLEVETAPIRLEGLDVQASGRRRCRAEGVEADEIQLVWDEARKALAAASWTALEAGLGYELQQRVRILDPGGSTVVDDSRSTMRSRGANTVRTLEPADLAERGYVREQGGFVYYYGPDASVLLSNPFLDTHCFRVVPGPEEERHLVGLEFEPVRGHPRPDIEGVLWMDAVTARLERIEFDYTDLPNDEGSDQARGVVRFLELADGRWIVRDWYIRAPILEAYMAVGAGGVRTTRIRVASVQELGTGVLSVIGPSGVEWEADDPEGRLRGVVFDSIAGRALAGADVRLAGRGWRTTTDEAGRWELANVPPGAYRIGFEHPVLDSLGVEPTWRDVTVLPDTINEVFLSLPPLERILARACEVEGGVVVGFVRDDLGRPLGGVEVHVVGGIEEATPRPPVVTDEEGAYTICGLPAGVEVVLEARAGRFRSAEVRAVTMPDVAVRADIRLTLP